MPRYAYERLSAQDYSFLLAETETAPMHVAAMGILEADALRHPEGGIDIARFRAAVEGILHWIPRYRQKLAWIPIERWPTWVDDRYFDLGYHIRHIALPAPGTRAQLREIAGRIFSRRLDRQRPLWELWVIEGLEKGTQVALLNKIHHCMIDGAAGADLSTILFSPSPKVETGEPLPYYPRPAPTGAELLSDRVREAFGAPRQVIRGVRTFAAGDQRALLDDVAARARALAELAGLAFKPASESPINGELGPHRRVDWLTMPLDDVRELRRALGCTINDVVLATVTEALRRYLFRRRVDAAKLDFRVSIPVNTRSAEQAKSMGNHVSTWILRLPLEQADPVDQIEAIRAQTLECKQSNSALALDTVMKAAEYLPVGLLRRGVGLVRGQINTIVTNVPGPQFPLYSVGAKLLGMYPIVPLIPGCGLGVALFSYEGKLCWGFNADYQLVPNLDDFAADVGTAFESLRKAAVSRFLSRRTAPTEEPETRAPATTHATSATHAGADAPKRTIRLRRPAASQRGGRASASTPPDGLAEAAGSS
ncbi:MAG: wax ester/triacylglycerol synthase family O-acyltransferase [Myxococcota bacterium]